MIVVFTLLLLIVVSFLFLLCLYGFVFCHPYKMRPDAYIIPSSSLYKDHKDTMLALVKDMDRTPYTPMTIHSFDGCELHGRMYYNKTSAPTILFFHGYHGTFAWDGHGIYKFAKSHGFNILLVDVRAHGKSQGHISFGIKERYDCKFWTEHIISQLGSDCQIVLAGVSMGAASILMSSSLHLPSNVKGLICDCSFSEPADIIKETVTQIGLPVFPFYNLIKLSGHIFGGFDLDEASPLNSVKNLSLPILFLHGNKDSIVPLQMCDLLYANCTAPKRRVIIENADHANSAMVNYSLYESAISEFLFDLL